ncbi:MAG: UDP-N-acetylmuramate--L-alanine ligase [Phycisphaerae bacterium]|nr:UDP-N-acetylmuramate--L-alanine ligase [Phycisphaerae bacterium]
MNGQEKLAKTSNTYAPAPARPGSAYAGKNVHLIGIGGCGMSGLASVLLAGGAHVSGSDRAPSATTVRLAEAGAAVSIGQKPENLPVKLDLVVASAAVPPQNPELAEARSRGVEVIKYSQLLGRLMADSIGLAIAGTHGKSTTSAMVAYVLMRAGADPTYVIGATVPQLGGSSRAGGGPCFVAEACEYDASFLNLHPTVAAILNIEEDHLDYYKDLNAIVASFAAFASLAPRNGLLIVNGEDPNTARAVEGVAARVETFGLGENCRWRAVNVELDGGTHAFDVRCGDRVLGRCRLRLAGRHNVYNALAAAAMTIHCGVPATQALAYLGEFTGADRRMTLRGRVNGVTVVDDYAHHPTEIQATLRAVRQYHQPARLWCVFQPHQHSRTRFLMRDFARSFAQADTVLLPPIYFVRDSEAERKNVSAADLASQIRLVGGDAESFEDFDTITAHLRSHVRAGDLILTMGAGDVWKIADDYLQGS